MLGISRSKDNKTMKYGQLKEYNIRNIFFENSCAEYSGETSPRPFLKKINYSISQDQQSEFPYSLFLLHVKSRTTKVY